MPVPREVHYVALTLGQKVHVLCFEPFLSNSISWIGALTFNITKKNINTKKLFYPTKS